LSSDDALKALPPKISPFLQESHERLNDARLQVKRCQANLALVEVNDPSNDRLIFGAKRALLAAERELTEASHARDQALAKLKALG
jgi:hypothetical protein